MTWGNRIRLMLGLIAVVAVVAVLTVQLNERQGSAVTAAAGIEAETYDVGTPYPGLVIDALVAPGEAVVAGDALFTIESASLQHDLQIGLEPASSEGAQVGADGRVTLTATGPGTVTELLASSGSFVQSGGLLATVQRADTLYVQADYTLSASEYARIPDDAVVTIELPNRRSVTGSVQSMQVERVGDQAQAMIAVVSDDLVEGAENGLVAAGTPVTATLQLRNDGVVTTVSTAVQTYVGQVIG